MAERILMQRIPVNTDEIRSIGYDVLTERLEVEFRRGDVYEFYQVPQVRYELLVHSGMVDQYFHRYIRDRYQFLRIS